MDDFENNEKLLQDHLNMLMKDSPNTKVWTKEDFEDELTKQLKEHWLELSTTYVTRYLFKQVMSWLIKGQRSYRLRVKN